MPDVLRLHHEQHAADTCVAACICMVQLARGEPSDEAAFVGAHASIGLVLTLPVTRRLPSYDTAEIRVALQTDESVVAIVHGPPYVRWQEAAHPGLESRHGRLCSPGDFGGPLHCVLLVHCDASGFLLLDPYFPATGQPLAMTEDAFERCFAGQAVAARRGV